MALDKDIRNKELLARIRSILEKRGLSQRDLANLLGKKEAEVSRWMSGKYNISRISQEKIEAALGEPISSDSTFRIAVQEIRIGIIGTGDMAGRFVKEAYSVKTVRVVSAFNPDQIQCRCFCSTRDIPRAASTFDELLSLVDAVYVASPVDTHYYYTKLALENGRHVLCEMPFTSLRTQADELIRLASRKNLVLMPAIKTAYCPSFNQMVLVAKSGMIGNVVDVSATVTNLLDKNVSAAFANERMFENFSYPILTFFKLLGLDYRHLDAFVQRDGDKLLFVHATVEYENAIGSFKVGIGVKSEGSLVVSGTKGYIYVPAPWWKPDYFEVRFENPADNKKFFFPYESTGLRYEIQALDERIRRTAKREFVSRDELLKMIEIQNKLVR